MTDPLELVYLSLLLILPVSALAARRLPVGATFKLAIVWIAIFGVLFVVVMLWQGAVGAGVFVGSTLY